MDSFMVDICTCCCANVKRNWMIVDDMASDSVADKGRVVSMFVSLEELRREGDVDDDDGEGVSEDPDGTDRGELWGDEALPVEVVRCFLVETVGEDLGDVDFFVEIVLFGVSPGAV